ncbi:MAG: HAD-IIB family hydrolase [Halieaceae bacterium]|nr:HAD-IIB family hydrolase [Halieaceae bacterium]
MPERLLLCTDLDRTLIPNGPQPESPGARDAFTRLVGDTRVVLVYVTGRHRQLVEEALEQYELPQPDFVIGDVGTTIYRMESAGRWQPDPSWDKQIGSDWQGMTNPDLQGLLGDLSALRLQEAHKQNSHKLSYYHALDCDLEATSSAIETRLQSRGVKARLVWSVDEPEGVGLLDILPRAASKYHAIAWLQRQLAFTDDDTVFSGDSGNDIEVLASPVPAVLVANCEAQVREQALREAAAQGYSDRLYLARGGFRGMNGNYSAGILEGIAHYHPSLLQQADPEVLE